MNDPVVMQVGEAREKLVKETFHFRETERLAHGTQKVSKIVFTVLEDQKDTMCM